jgi:hypothetical protein
MNVPVPADAASINVLVMSIIGVPEGHWVALKSEFSWSGGG